MEVKPGYKQTEVGVIPDDWDLKTLESLTSLLTNGLRWDRNQCLHPKATTVCSTFKDTTSKKTTSTFAGLSGSLGHSTLDTKSSFETW